MTRFGIWDYLIVIFTMIVSLGIGIYHGIKVKGTNEILFGVQTMSALPVGISMLVTFLSATSIIGFPAEIYQSGIQIFFIKIFIMILTIPVASFVFIKVLYDFKIKSVYEYLQLRFNSVVVRMVASLIFMFQCCIVCAVALYTPSLLLETFFDIPTWISLICSGLIGTIYTSFGGFKAVIWTDVFQFFLIIIGMSTITIKGLITAGGFFEAFNIAKTHGRLEFFDWTVDICQEQNTLNIVLGLFISQIGFFGTHQAHVMRYCSLPTFSQAMKSIVWKGILQAIVQCLIICTGVGIFATYANCDPLLLGKIKRIDQIVPYFYITELGNIPGMMGLFTSCILSAVLSTISSILNSLAAVTYSDFISKIPYFKKFSEKKRVSLIIYLTGFYGFIITFTSFAVGKFGSIFRLLYIVIGSFGGTICGTFLIGLLVPVGNKIGALAGLLVGSFLTSYIALGGFLLDSHSYSLPTNISSCPNGTNYGNLIDQPSVDPSVKQELEWPEKIYTVSYMLYPVIGCLITMIVNLTVSIISNWSMKLLNMELDNGEELKYLHPIIRSLFNMKSSKRTYLCSGKN